MQLVHLIRKWESVLRQLLLMVHEMGKHGIVGSAGIMPADCLKDAEMIGQQLFFFGNCNRCILLGKPVINCRIDIVKDHIAAAVGDMQMECCVIYCI